MDCCFLNTQYNLSLPSFVTNFKILSQEVLEKSVKESFPVHYIGERGGKAKNRKRRQNKLLANKCSYTQYTWPPSRLYNS